MMPNKLVWTDDDLAKLPASRGAAITAGEMYFFNGTPCSRGHVTARTAAAGKCLECFRAQRREAMRRRRAAPKEPTGERIATIKHGLSRSLAMMLYIAAQNRARKKGVEFSIRVTDIVIPDRCPILDTPLDLSWGGRAQTSKARENAPSLDRLDPRKGYTPDNIVVISYRANMIKGDGLPSEHRKVAEFMRAGAAAARETGPAPLPVAG